MNCNTTHYRANSSSVPGDPTDKATGQPHTAHTTYPVPFILFDPTGRHGKLRGDGALENVAPTLLAILGIEKPAEMTAESLLMAAGAS